MNKNGTGLFTGIIVAVLFLGAIGWLADLAEPKCRMAGCDNRRADGSSYCFLHQLSYQTYGTPDYHAVYQKSRERQKQAADTYSANKSNNSRYSSTDNLSGRTSGSASDYSSSGSRSTGQKAGTSSGNRSYSYDPYDAEQFDNADDFADEWAEEFGDGDFEEGYEDAYDYWENEYKRNSAED